MVFYIVHLIESRKTTVIGIFNSCQKLIEELGKALGRDIGYNVCEEPSSEIAKDKSRRVVISRIEINKLSLYTS